MKTLPKVATLIVSIFSFIILSAQTTTPNFSMIGFATLDGGTTGGDSGQVVTPQTFAELKSYVQDSSTAYVIKIAKEFTTGVETWVDEDGSIVDSTTSGAIKTTFGTILRIGSNKTLLGVDSSAFFNRIGLVIQCQSNIIIRNIKFTMLNVPATKADEYKILDTDGTTTIGDPDCIGIQADASSVAKDDRICQHIWIDHCEFYNKNIDNKDRYDGLLDTKNNVQDMTISWCYFHDHCKALLSGKGNSDNYNRTVTYHHNYFYQINGSRLPLLRYGQHHYFNNFMEDCGGDGLDLRIKSNGYIEQNYFKDSKKPIFGKISESGQGILIDNIFDNCSRLPSGISNLNGEDSDPLSDSEEFERACDFTPSELYSYSDVLTTTKDVPSIVKTYSGVGKISNKNSSIETSRPTNWSIWENNDGISIKAEEGVFATIYNISGKIIYRSLLEKEISTIPLNQEGIYIVTLKNSKTQESFKIIR